MYIDYDGTKIDCDEGMLEALKKYAKSVLEKMQKADPDYDECWTACVITFEGLQPEFTYGAIEDLDKFDGVFVEVPLD